MAYWETYKLFNFQALICLYASRNWEHEISWGEEGGRVRTIHFSVSVSGSSRRLLMHPQLIFLLSDLWMNSLTLKRWKLEFTSPKHLCCEWVPSCFPCQRQQHDQINYHYPDYHIYAQACQATSTISSGASQTSARHFLHFTDSASAGSLMVNVMYVLGSWHCHWSWCWQHLPFLVVWKTLSNLHRFGFHRFLCF